LGFTRSKADPNLYLKVVDDEPIIPLLCDDDLFLTRNEKQIMKMAAEIKMKDLRLMHYFLGLEVWHDPKRNLLNRGKHAEKI
jgi:hypothetical protein